MALCQGNRLYIAYYDQTDAHKPWFVTRTIDAPALPRRPLPTAVPVVRPPTPTSAPAPMSRKPTVAIATPDRSALSDIGLGAGTSTGEQLLPLLVSVGPALFLAVGVIVLLRRRPRR